MGKIKAKIKLYLIVLKRLGGVIYCAMDYGIAYLKNYIKNWRHMK